jgi:hypothetical protein
VGRDAGRRLGVERARPAELDREADRIARRDERATAFEELRERVHALSRTAGHVRRFTVIEEL